MLLLLMLVEFQSIFISLKRYKYFICFLFFFLRKECLKIKYFQFLICTNHVAFEKINKKDFYPKTWLILYKSLIMSTINNCNNNNKYKFFCSCVTLCNICS